VQVENASTLLPRSVVMLLQLREFQPLRAAYAQRLAAESRAGSNRSPKRILCVEPGRPVRCRHVLGWLA